MRFLIKYTWKEAPTEAALVLIPAEQAEQGIQEATYVTADRSAAWLVWNYASLDAVEESRRTLPLSDYFKAEITLLADNAS